MMHGREKSDLVIVAMKSANKARKAHCGGVCGGGRSGVGGAKGGAKGNTHQQSTYWAQNQARVSHALERIRQPLPSHTRGGSRVRESRTHGSGRGACDETHVPTATSILLRLLTSAYGTSRQFVATHSFGRNRRHSRHSAERCGPSVRRE